MYNKLYYSSFHISLILILILFNFSNNYIVIPFKLTNPDYNLIYDNSSDFISKFKNEIDKKRLYITIDIGEPKKKSIFFLTMNDYFGLLKNYCPKDMISLYNPYESNTFTFNPSSSCTQYDLFNAKLGNDTFYIYSDKQMKDVSKVNINILIDNQTYIKREGYESDAYCGKIGLIVRDYYPFYYSNLISNLKKYDIIKSYQWGIFFFDKEQSYNISKEIQNNYEGFFIAGLTKDDYLNIFNTDLIYNTYQEMPLYNMLGGKFNKIYFKNLNDTINCSENIYFEINVEKNYITCTKEYFNNIKKYFFNKYFENKICKEIISEDKYNKGDSMIICDLSFKNELNKFPKLFLLYKELNFTFNLNYKDVFIEIKDKIYFIIILPEKKNLIWNFGNILIKKYSFIFNQDSMQIYFVKLKKYDLNEEDNENKDNEINENSYSKIDYKKYIYLSLFIVLIIIALIIGFIFGRKIWEKHRKRKAYELDDDYDYIKENDKDNITNIVN